MQSKIEICPVFAKLKFVFTLSFLPIHNLIERLKADQILVINVLDD